MRPQTITASAAGTTAWLPVDHRAQNFQIGLGAVVSGGATLTYDVEHTFNNVLAGEPATAFKHASLVGQTANANGNYAFPVAAIRLNVTAYTSGSVTLNILQASGQG